MCYLNFLFGIHNNAVVLYIIGKGTGRKPKSLSFFLGKSFKLQTSVEHWNKKEKRFNEEIPPRSSKGKPTPIPTATEENKKLEALKKELEAFASSFNCFSIENFLNCWEAAKNIEESKEFTLLTYSQHLVQLWKEGKANTKYKKATTNWQLYQKFTHKLQGKSYRDIMNWANEIKKFAEMPISQINDDVYQDFAKFCVKNNISKETINFFRIVVYHYQRQFKGNEDFKFNLKAIKKITENQKQQISKTIALSTTQFELFKNADLSKILPKCTAHIKMCHDALLLLYYTFSRPTDLISFKIEDLRTKEVKGEEVIYWRYCAQKKCNYGKPTLVPLHENALKIINKYKGNRKSGYLFPFACNKNDKPKKRNTNKYSTDMGNLLQAIAKHYNWQLEENEKFASYSMRKSAITHAIENKVYSVETIANWAQTSIEEINAVYCDYEMIANHEFLKARNKRTIV